MTALGVDDPRAYERHPLLTGAGVRMLARLREHPDAPRFNHTTGDRLRAEDLPVLDAYREALGRLRGRREPGELPALLASRVAGWRESVPFFRESIPKGLDAEKDWERLPTTSRADVALSAWKFVPDGEPLDRLVIYRTAGTTGHPISVPHHPLAIRCYEPLLETALARYGAEAPRGEESVACFLVGAQVRTYTYAALLHTWGGAGFAKLNIRQTEWPREGSQRRYFEDHAPRLLTGDAISFAEMMRMDLPATPVALVPTSVAMPPHLKVRLSERYAAPVVDWYSLVETGPIGYGCPKGEGFHLLPHDVHLEALRPDGSACAAGERGEITVTGGRNPFFPLVRYRTGDYGRLAFDACACGDAMPRILDLEGREPVLFRSSDGTPVTTVDLSRLLREHPLLLHEFVQHGDRSCVLTYRPLPGARVDVPAMEGDLRRVLGSVPLDLVADATLGDRAEGKVRAYTSELMVEE